MMILNQASYTNNWTKAIAFKYTAYRSVFLISLILIINKDHDDEDDQ